MTHRLANDDITLSHGGHSVRLRPSLRAGLLLSQRYPIGVLYQAIIETNVTIILDIVQTGADDPIKARDLITRMMEDRGIKALQSFTLSIVHFLAQSFGFSAAGEEETETAKAATKGEGVDFASALTEQFEFATGALHWSPTDAWAATPVEIEHARKGHFAMLRAIHGSGEETDPRDLPTDAEIKSGLDTLRHLSGQVA